jgi:DNA repair exonuclease SbcCD ATPase subunit
MKLKEFVIMRYGPLLSTGKISLRNFNLFLGKNEDGKTLTIDALVKLLLGRDVKDFEHIDRVEEKPEGYVTVEDDQGREIKLPEKGDLTKLGDLTSSECRNIFVIRNSDLSIVHEGAFYTNVTDRLTGLRTEELSDIKENLREIGKTTPTGEFRDIREERLKTRIREAGNLVEEIEDLAKKIQEERFDEFEEESAKRREEIERIEQEIENLEDARKRSEYEKGRKALNALTNALKEVEGLGIYNENDKQLWRDCEKIVKDNNERKEECLGDLRGKNEQLQKTIGKLNELENEFRIFEGRKRKLDDEVKPDLKNYDMGLGEVKSKETRNRFYGIAAITSSVLLAISILAVVLGPSPVSYGLLALFLISTAVFAGLRFEFTRKKAHIAGVFARIRASISRFELEAESPEELYSNIQKFEEKYSDKFEELQRLREERRGLEDRIDELRDKEIPRIESRIEDAEEEIQKIKEKSKDESSAKYTEKLETKEELETSIGEQKSVLRSHFGGDGNGLEESISHWKEAVVRLEGYKDKAKDINYSGTAVSELTSAKQERERKLAEIKEGMLPLQEEMREVERKVNNEILLDEYLYCKTSVDLEALKSKLQVFIDDNERKRENVLKVMEIFEGIEREEKERVSELFGGESLVSKYFSEITNGLYKEVLIEQEALRIQVRMRDGKILTAEKLSGGAYDQLYLSIRLALGEKLLKGKAGFFIMDDPFVKADLDRLQRQMQTLKRISELGWQVMYFSAKGEIKDALEEDIRRGTINYIEVQGISS